MHRVLKPGGTLMVLEFSLPRHALVRRLYRFYSFKAMPFLAGLICGASGPFRYLAESISLFPPPEEVAAMIARAGFSRVSFRRLTDGIAVIYLARKPSRTRRPPQRLHETEDRSRWRTRSLSSLRHVQIDYLGTGSLRVGAEKVFVTYYPQGRMDLCVPLPRAVFPDPGPCRRRPGLRLCAEPATSSATSSPACGLAVMKALKEHVEELVASGVPVEPVPEDEPLKRLRAVVGAAWATNDPAVLLTYADDPFPLAGPKMPAYVVLPGSRDEVAAVVKLATAGCPSPSRGAAGRLRIRVPGRYRLDMNRMRTSDRAAAVRQVVPG
jgi:hypothetical protein